MTLELEDLGLMSFQLAEVEQEDDAMVVAWLEAASAPNVRNPGGFFLAGIRSGRLPLGGSTPTPDEQAHPRKILLAEGWIKSTGLFFDRPGEILIDLFDNPGALLHHAREDETLRKRMLRLWAQERPRGIEIEQQAEEHAARQREAYRLLQGGKDK